MALSVQTGEGVKNSFTCFLCLEENRYCSLIIEYQHIRYLPSVVRDGQAKWANSLFGLQDPDIERQFSMKAMTGRGDNDTSVKSKVERDKTVATKDDGRGRTSRW